MIPINIHCTKKKIIVKQLILALKDCIDFGVPTTVSPQHLHQWDKHDADDVSILSGEVPKFV